MGYATLFLCIFYAFAETTGKKKVAGTAFAIANVMVWGFALLTVIITIVTWVLATPLAWLVYIIMAAIAIRAPFWAAGWFSEHPKQDKNATQNEQPG